MHAACRNPPRREPTAPKCISAPELVPRASEVRRTDPMANNVTAEETAAQRRHYAAPRRSF